MRVDINCDMGESFGAYTLGEDESIIAYISSANIACGFHAGDPMVMARTVELATRHHAAVGAHPSYPDIMGFGRRNLQTFPGEIKNYVLCQIGALDAFARSNGTQLQHVKPHGALYNLAARDEAAALEVIAAVKSFNPELILVTLAGSLCADLAVASGLRCAREAFPDRAYLGDGQLAPRSMEGSVIHDEQAVQQRIVKLVREGRLTSIDGEEMTLAAETLCVHGDTPGAWKLAQVIRQTLQNNGIEVAPMAQIV